jgi:hypothetical protein
MVLSALFAAPAFAACDTARLEAGFAFCWQDVDGTARADCDIVKGGVHCDMGRPHGSWYLAAMVDAVNRKSAGDLTAIFNVCQAYDQTALADMAACAGSDADIIKAARVVISCRPPVDEAAAIAPGATPVWGEAADIGAPVCEQ